MMTSSIIGADQARYNCKYSLNGSQFAMTAKAAQDRSTVSFIQLQAVFTYKIASSKQANVCNVVPDDADRWPDELRISDVEDKFVCTDPPDPSSLPASTAITGS